MAGAINMGAYALSNLPAPAADSDAAMKLYADNGGAALSTRIDGTAGDITTPGTQISGTTDRVTALESTATTLGGQVVAVATDSEARDLTITKALAAAPRENANYLAYDMLDGSNLRQLVSVRKSDAKAFYLTNSNDNVLGAVTDDNLVMFSRPNGLGNRDTLFVPAEGGTAFPLTSTPDILCLGESTTEGGPFADKATQSYPAYLAAALSYKLQDGIGGPSTGAGNWTVTNDGLGGQTSDQEAARFNAKQVLISPGTIPADTSTITIGSANISFDLLWSGDSQYVAVGRPAIINGVPGTLARLAGGDFGAGNYTFARTTAGSAVTVAPGTILEMDLAACTNRSMVLWPGRNDDLSNLAATRTNITNILAVLTPLSKRFLVLGITTKADGSEAHGSTAYNEVIAHNEAIGTVYGLRFLDVRTYLVQHAIADAIALGIMPARSADQIAADTTAAANDDIPPSLVGADGLHPLPFTYQIIAAQVHGRMVQMGWL